ncbi:MAG: photosynthetic reaction center subunit H [Alphaproteobacteria bacterium]|nr:photosynthetic reaction center subunit H [Alphaproteobacteria bacterium]
MNLIGDITGYIDVAQVVLYVFWVFFAGLIIYLVKENKREGYPLDSDRTNARVSVIGWPEPPDPVTYVTAQGERITAPTGKGDDRPIAAEPAAPWPGAPLVPTGNPMLDCVGPGSYAQRQDKPDLTNEGAPKLVPNRIASDFHVDERDPNPVGMEVVGLDGKVGGTVSELWIDRAEHLIRYLEVDTGGSGSVLLPMTMARVTGGQVRVASVKGEHFADVPKLANPDQVTRLEEEKITAYYAAGHLYATPQRLEPLL